MSGVLSLIECRRRRRSYLPRTARTWLLLNVVLWAALGWLLLW